MDRKQKAEFEAEMQLLEKEGLKQHPLRREYEEKVRLLASEKAALYEAGCSEEEIAKILHRRRRQLGEEYKNAAPPLFARYIFFATQQKYGDPLGPDYETLRQTKTPAQIIESASRPIRNLDDRLTADGFAAWFAANYSDAE